jgi:excisionase family DNA binding protein
MENSTPIQLFRITEIGTRLALSRSSIYREIEAGNLHAIRIGKSLRVSGEEITRYIDALSERSNQTA